MCLLGLNNKIRKNRSKRQNHLILRSTQSLLASTWIHSSLDGDANGTGTWACCPRTRPITQQTSLMPQGTTSHWGGSNQGTFHLWGHSANRQIFKVQLRPRSLPSTPWKFSLSVCQLWAWEAEWQISARKTKLHASFNSQKPKVCRRCKKTKTKKSQNICLYLKGNFAQKKKAIKKKTTKVQSICTLFFRLFDGREREKMSLPEGEAKPECILQVPSLFLFGERNFVFPSRSGWRIPRPGDPEAPSVMSKQMQTRAPLTHVEANNAVL